MVAYLTFNSCHKLLEQAGDAHQEDSTVLALVARADGRPIGLALAEKIGQRDSENTIGKKSLLLHSVFINLLWQNKGVGKLLLAFLETAARDAGYIAIRTEYGPKLDSFEAFERLLASQGWSNPVPFMEESLFRIEDMVDAAWLKRVPELQEGDELVMFDTLTESEHADIHERLRTGDIPQGLSPFAEGEHLVPELSVGLRHEGRIVAWMSLVRSYGIKDALCYRSLYVDPTLRMANGLGPIVAAEAFRRHAESAIAIDRPKGVFYTHHTAVKQMNFVRKRLLPCCFESYAFRSSELDLQQPSSA